MYKIIFTLDETDEDIFADAPFLARLRPTSNLPQKIQSMAWETQRMRNSFLNLMM
jgi:hypothetical protein